MCERGAQYWSQNSTQSSTVHIFQRDWSLQHLAQCAPLARKCFLSMTHEVEVKSCRKDLFEYFNTLMVMIEDQNENEVDRQLIENFNSFRKLFRSIDRLPEPSLSPSANELRHMYHAYLEIHWMQLNFIIKYIQISEDELKNIRKAISSEISSLMFSILVVSHKLFSRNGHDAVFGCGCLSTLWKHIVILVGSLEEKRFCSEFWEFFNEIAVAVFIKNGKLENASESNFSFPYTIDSKQPVSFVINILKHVAIINNENYTPNFALVECILKQLENEELSEVNLRNLTFDISYLMDIWKPKVDVIITLWEYFHKKLNSAFTIPGDNNFLQCFDKSSIMDISKDVKNMLVEKSSKDDCSFVLFLKILGSFLKNNPNQCHRIKGRIFPKFTAGKIEALNDVGFRNFCILYLIMAVSTNVDEICPKLTQLLNQLNFNKMDDKKKLVMMKIELVMIYLYVEEDKDAGGLIEPLLSILSECCSSRDHSVNKLMSCVNKGIQDIIFNASTTFKNGEAALIGSWVPKYIAVCPYSDLLLMLQTLTGLIGKTRQICRYYFIQQNEDQKSTGLELLISNLFTHVLPSLKLLFSNEETALNVADVCLEFVKLTIENKHVCENHINVNDLLKQFIQHEQFNERAAHQFIINLLEQDDVVRLLESSDTISESILIECWIKCALLHNDKCSQLPPLLINLQHLKHLKQITSYVDVTDPNQNHLSLLFYGLGALWKNCQNFQEKLQLRNIVNQYLGSMDKLLVQIVKTCTSLKYLTEIIMAMGTLFLHCSPIIYYRAKASCLFHSIVNSVLLPPQMFIENKRNSQVTSAVCKSWFMFMCGVFQLDKDNDPYIENTLRDLLLLYLPHFVNIGSGELKYEIVHRILPTEISASYSQLEVFIFQKMATVFISCRGKQTHQHAAKALAIIHNYACNAQKLDLIVKHALFAIFEQCMFADQGGLSFKLAHQILEAIGDHFDSTLESSIKETITTLSKKYFSFYSNQFFKLLQSFPASLKKINREMIPYLQAEVEKLEKMRGVKEDAGLSWVEKFKNKL